MVKPPKPNSNSTLSNSPSATPHPTLNNFLASPSKRPASTTPSSAKPPKKSRPAARANFAVKEKGKAKVVPKKRTQPKPDNRNLGTLDLLDTTDEEFEEVEGEARAEKGKKTPASKGGKGKGKQVGEAQDVKGKGRMQLVEEEWMGDGSASGSKDGGANDEAETSFSSAVATGSSSSSCDAKALDFAEAEPKQDESKKKEVQTKPMEIEIQDDMDDDEVEILAVEGGGVEKCKRCGEVVQGWPKKKRDSHFSTCSPSTSSASTSSSRSILAPISRLFRSAPTPAPSVSTAPSTSKDDKKPSSSIFSALPNAFTALMQGHSETKQWKEAEESDKKKGRLPQGEKRGVPFYKWIDGMEVTVDAFKYGKIEGCKAYFLSHAHSDHYQNLNSSWSHGPIYASQTTCNLIKLKLNVKDEWLFPLPLDKTVKVHGIDVTLIDANHCPGSVLFLFEGPHTSPTSPYSKSPNKIFRYLHCGDFRASPAHILHPSLSFPAPPPTSRYILSSKSSSSSKPAPPDPLQGRTLKPLAAIYLDTTYLNPSYCFPAQQLVIDACAELVKERVESGREEVLWRADGREGEREGMKAFLGGGGRGGGAKQEEEGEATPFPEMEELEELPEENEGDEEEEGEEVETKEGEENAAAVAGLAPSQEKGKGKGIARVDAEGEEEDDGGDEEAWLAVHAAVEAADSGSPDAAPISTTVDAGVLVATKVEVEQEGGGEVKMEAKADVEMEELKEEECEPLGELDAAGEVKPAFSSAVKAEEEEEAKPVKAEEDVKPKAEGEDDVKPDVKPKKKERLLVLIGTYSIGKERIVKAVAHALSTKIYGDARKRAHFLAQDDPELHALITDDPLEAAVHVGWLKDISRETMQEYLGKYGAKRVEGGFDKLIGLRPTGWTYRPETKEKNPSIAKILQLEQQRKFSPAGLYPQRDSTPLTMAFGVPYSEHSSFFELTCFCLSLDYQRIIPTVNVHTASSRDKMKGWIDRWAAEKKTRKEKRLPKIVPFRAENYW